MDGFSVGNTNEIVRAIDSLMNELDQLANSSDTDSQVLFQRVEDTIDAVIGPKSSALFLVGPNQTLCNAGNSKSSWTSFFPVRNQIMADLASSTDGIVEFESGKTMNVAVRLGTETDVQGLLAAKVPSSDYSGATRSVLTAVGELANRFVAGQMQKSTEAGSDYQKRLNEFSVGCLSTIDDRELAKVIANDARLLLECERVQVYENRSNRAVLKSVSSVAVFEKRTELLRAANRLASQVLKLRKPILSSQAQEQKNVAADVEEYGALSGMPFFAFLPLQPKRIDAETKQDSGQKRLPPACGVLVFEFSEPPNFLEFVRTANVAVPHAGLALANAQTVAAIPFHKSLLFLGRVMNLQSLTRLVTWLLLPLCLLFLLFFIKTDFKVRMNGTLRAVEEQMVFASHDAFVDQVHVDHSDSVVVGQLLVELRSPDLELELENASGEINKLTKFKAAKEIALNQAASGNAGDRATQAKLASEVADIEFQIQSFIDKREFARYRMEELKVYSPIAGRVVTWNVKKLLDRKPVRWGDPLMKIADEESDWELRFKASENKIGYIEEAAKQEKDGFSQLKVQYFFQSNPEQKFTTNVRNAADSTEMDPEFGASVAVNCPIDAEQKLKRHGAKVVGDVVCGKRSVIYVWTYELVDAVRRQFVW